VRVAHRAEVEATMTETGSEVSGHQASTGAGSGPGLVARAAAASAASKEADRAQLGVLGDIPNPLLWHTVAAQGPNGPAAEAAAQTAGLKLVEHADRIESPRAVVAWLMTTVRRESWRSGKAAGREEGDIDALPEPMSPEPGPEAAAVLRQQEKVLWRNLARLG